MNSSDNFVSHPDIVSENPEMGVISGMWYFKERVVNSSKLEKAGGFDNSDQSVKLVSKLVNGGYTGLAERINLFHNVDRV